MKSTKVKMDEIQEDEWRKWMKRKQKERVVLGELEGAIVIIIIFQARQISDIMCAKLAKLEWN